MVKPTLAADDGGSGTLRPVAVLGHHDPSYPRNRALTDALRTAGRAVVPCHSRAPFPLRHLILAQKLMALPRDVRVVVVTEGGHRLVPWVRALAGLTGRRVMFDPFLSRYSTRVEDRQLHAPGSLQARIAHFQDWSSTHAADFLLFDTEEHRAYFFERYGLEKPSAILPVGIPEPGLAYAARVREADASRDRPLDVLFYGTYIPLQGIETILEAAAAIGPGGGVRFTLVGDGQTGEAMRSLAARLSLTPPFVRFCPPLAFTPLMDRLRACDVALGIFGATDKAGRVVPNKVVQAAALGRPILTADSPAIRRYFQHGGSAHLVPPADPHALVEGLRSLAGDPARRLRLGVGARRTFERYFAQDVAARTLASALLQLETPPSTT